MTEPAGNFGERAEEEVGTARDRDPRMPAVGPRAIALTAFACYVTVVVAGVFSWSVAALAAVVVSQGLDFLIVGNEDVRAALARGQFGIATRTLVRELGVVMLVLTAAWAGRADARASALLLLGVAGLRYGYQLLLVLVRRRSMPPVEARNIDLSGLRLAPPVSDFFRRRLSERFHALSALALVGAGIGVASHLPALLYAVVGLVVLVEGAAVAWAMVWLVRSRGAVVRDRLHAALLARVNALNPEVMLYHSGTEDTAYQVNMWLSTVDALARTTLIVVRERESFAQLGKTTSPAVCIPDPVDFMTFKLPSIRVAMYTANVGKTIHMLREPGVRHVFVGHGDSDKAASSNPFSKVYTEIWVAGRGGRDRYSKAGVGIHDDDIVEVGRPQLGGIEQAPGASGERLTVLYAPTWEGWTGDPAHTSLVRTGPELVRRLLAREDVRLVYKPHPLTGTVSIAAAKADVTIRSLVTRAGSPHATVGGTAPTLYECFNDADLLVADISSVLSDFIISEKPYIVINLTGLTDEAFRAEFPSAGEAYLLDSGAERLDAILVEVRGDDPLAAARRRLKEYLLGPSTPDAMTRFSAAVDAAYDAAVAAIPHRVAAGAG
ncbi:MAG TPA: CDP-glycerol glycerophosphotransferase family protein [Mycobacteriales bacterium]|nr:CDP-glycerol glycerophosphotransferase family protein [Mycobacteriales bacterium]